MSEIPLLLPDGSLNPAHPRCGEEYADTVHGGDPAITRRVHRPHRTPTPFDGDLAALDAKAVEMGRCRIPTASEWSLWQTARDAVLQKIFAFRDHERSSASA
mgnify:FL=1